MCAPNKVSICRISIETWYTRVLSQPLYLAQNYLFTIKCMSVYVTMMWNNKCLYITLWVSGVMVFPVNPSVIK